MPKTKNLGIDYEEWAPRVLYFPAAMPDPQGSIQHMEDTDEWYANDSEYNEEIGGTPRDDCHIRFPNQIEADVVTECFRAYNDLYGHEFLDKEFARNGYHESDIEYNGVRYRVGGEAKTHRDQPVEHDIGLVNICLYPNEDYEGGELGFDFLDIPLYKPGAGDIIIFPGNFDHYALPTKSGKKYLVLLKVFVTGPGIVTPPELLAEHNEGYDVMEAKD